jgi:hypothetical protein
MRYRAKEARVKALILGAVVAALVLPASAASPPKNQVPRLERQIAALAPTVQRLEVRVGRDPVPLQGIPLRSETGVRLVVSQNPPLILDVDTGNVSRVRGIPYVRGRQVVIVRNRRAPIAIAEPYSRRGKLYAVRGQQTRAMLLGAGSEAAPAVSGESVWVKRVLRRSHCSLRQVRLDGRVVRAARAFRCAWTVYPGGELGLGVGPTRVIDPVTGRTVFKTRLGIVAVAGKTVVLQQSGRQFTLVDTASGAQRRLAWPDTEALGSHETDVDVRGRFVALSFGNPSWTSEAGQFFDVWVLDTQTAKLTQLPDMPAFVWLKWTNMAWTEDGRLVLLARSAGKDMVAVWQPGQERLEVKKVRLPGRNSVYSDSFAPLG